MNKIEKFKAAAKYAKQLGFDDVGYDYDQFWARDMKTSVTVFLTPKSVTDRRMRLEISWSSAGTPRPTPAKVRQFIRMLQNALKLREKLVGR